MTVAMIEKVRWPIDSVGSLLLSFDKYGRIGSTPDEPTLDELVAALFSAGEQGAWYDPSDLTTLYRDAAGTTPVTAVEQPVGLMLDKSKGLVFGPELVTNGDFSDGATGWTAQVNTNIAVTSGELVVTNVGFSYGTATQEISTVAGKWYRVSASVRTGTASAINVVARTTPTSGNLSAVNSSSRVTTNVTLSFAATGSTTYIAFVNTNTPNGVGYYDNISVRELPGNHAFQPTSTNRPVLSGRYNRYVGTETLATQSVTTLAANYTLSFSGTGSITLSGTATGTYSAGTHTITCTAGTLTSTVSGTVTKADLRVANDGVGLPAYQCVNTATDYDTQGFPLYLKFDGIDDAMQTNSIDFTATDKVTVFAGVRKLSDAAAGSLVELGTGAQNGSFQVAAPAGAAPNYQSFMRGTANSFASSSGFASPVTTVIAALGDIAADGNTLRANGAQVAQATTDQGTGNFGNHPLYIGARAGTSLPFNGHLYSLIVRGAQSTAQQIIDAETYINSKTRAYA